MTYELINPQPLSFAIGRDEVVVLLDTGERIAIAVESPRDPATLATHYLGIARQLDDEDETAVCADGYPIASRLPYSASPEVVQALGDAAIRREIRRTLLGGPASDPPLIAWSAELRTNASIRTALASAQRATAAVDLDSLF